jgi:hypothetical protein
MIKFLGPQSFEKARDLIWSVAGRQQVLISIRRDSRWLNSLLSVASKVTDPIYNMWINAIVR